MLAGRTGKCPHCGIVNRFEELEIHTNTAPPRSYPLDLYLTDQEYRKTLKGSRCTSCARITIVFDNTMIYPRGSQRTTAPHEVPEDISLDYNEACLLEHLSEKASAALARRCLQNMLHEQGIKERDLNQEIDKAILGLPSYLGDAIDAIRVLGNFAAHPIKYQNTGEIVEVEAGEVEWILETLMSLFDFYYVQPASTQLKKDNLNAKLTLAGKPLLK